MDEPKTKEELLESVGATNFTSAPEDVINSITKGTIPDATPLPPGPPLEEKKVTDGEVFKPSEQLLELLSTTGERRAQPIRNPASAFFNINSIDRYASAQYPTAQFALITQPLARLAANPASSYNMNLGRNLMSGYFHRLTVTEANIQFNIPTINVQNYIFTFAVYNIGAAQVGYFTVRLPYGYYTFQELAKKMQDSIKAVANGTFNLPNLVVTWTDGGGGAGAGFNFNSNSVNQLISFASFFPGNYNGVTPDPAFPNEGLIQTGTILNQALRAMFKFYLMIGVNANMIDNFQENFTTAPSYPTLIYTSYVDVISNKLSQFMRVKDSETSWSPDTSVITRIYLTNQGTITAPTVQYTDLSGNAPNQTIGFEEFAVGSRPFILNYTATTPKHIKWSPDQAVVDFDIRVVDEFGDQLPWDLAIPYPIGNQTSYSQQFFEFQLTVLCSET
jgi:hypothetical protein